MMLGGGIKGSGGIKRDEEEQGRDSRMREMKGRGRGRGKVNIFQNFRSKEMKEKYCFHKVPSLKLFSFFFFNLI